MIRVEGEAIKKKITENWEKGHTFELEAALVVNTVACAILNPSKDPNIVYFQRSNYLQCRVYQLGCY